VIADGKLFHVLQITAKRHGHPVLIAHWPAHKTTSDSEYTCETKTTTTVDIGSMASTIGKAWRCCAVKAMKCHNTQPRLEFTESRGLVCSDILAEKVSRMAAFSTNCNLSRQNKQIQRQRQRVAVVNSADHQCTN